MAKRRSLGVKAKLMGLLTGICLAALAAACTAFVLYDRQSYAEAKEATLEVLVDAVAQSALGPVAFGDEESAAYVLKSIERESTASAAAIYMADGVRLTQWKRGTSTTDLPEKVGAVPNDSGFVADLLRIRRPIEKDGNRAGVLYAEFSTEDIEARTQNFLRIAGTVLFLSFLGAWLAASLAQGILTKPVARLVSAVSRVQTDQDFSVRAEKISDDELGVLTDSFNAMVGAIEVRDRELEAHREDLEKRVAERTHDLDLRNGEMRLVLDNVDQGFVTIDLKGVLQSERSEAFDAFFGVPAAETTLADHLEAVAEGFGLAIEMGWEEVTDGLLPIELTLDQMPSRLHTSDDRHFLIEYRPIMDGGELVKALVIFSDVTDELARKRADTLQAETVAIFESIMKDRAGFSDFFKDSQRMAHRVLDDPDVELTVMMRDLHTLKGNFGVSGLHNMAAEIHSIEDRCIETGDRPSAEELENFREHWESFASRVETFMGEVSGSISIGLDEFELLRHTLEADGASEFAMSVVEHLTYEACHPRLQRLSAEAARLAHRMGKPDFEVNTEGGDVRLAPGSAWLWSVVTHLVRNAVDHGFSGAELTGPPQLWLRVNESGGHFTFEVEDNGKGVDWPVVRAKAAAAGLPHDSEADLSAALFADQFSTRSNVTDTSGRGVGLAAVRSSVEDHGGHIEVTSKQGAGAKFRLTVPLSTLCDAREEPGVSQIAQIA